MRALHLTEHMAGPFCTMILADMGAEVMRRTALRLGEQTDEILARLGVAPGDISALRRDRVI